MGIFMIGYDVEAGTPGDHEAKLKTPEQLAANTMKFMDRVSELHAQYEVPATLFITGSLLERVSEPFKKHLGNPWLDFQQHTYNHKSLKPAIVTHNGRVELFDWPTAKDNDEVRWELHTTNELFKKLLGIECHGLSTPFRVLSRSRRQTGYPQGSSRGGDPLYPIIPFKQGRTIDPRSAAV